MTDTKENAQNGLILVQCRQGKREGLEALVRTWHQPLFYYVKRLVGKEEDAWDVIQDAWLRVFRGIISVRSAAALPKWLYKVARSAAMTHLRKARHWNALHEESPDETVIDTAASHLTGDFSAQQIHLALEKLPLPEREVLTLHFLEGYQVAEIAEITDAPIGTVKSRMNRAKKNLRHVLEEER